MKSEANSMLSWHDVIGGGCGYWLGQEFIVVHVKKEYYFIIWFNWKE